MNSVRSYLKVNIHQPYNELALFLMLGIFVQSITKEQRIALDEEIVIDDAENGFKMSMEKGTLSIKKEEECKVFIKAMFSGPASVKSVDHIIASGIFNIENNLGKEFQKPVYIKLQHCVNTSDSEFSQSDMSFAIAELSGKKLAFTLIPGGNFPHHHDFGEITYKIEKRCMICILYHKRREQ